jgi:hypothetical protein
LHLQPQKGDLEIFKARRSAFEDGDRNFKPRFPHHR